MTIVNHYTYNEEADALDWVEAEDEFWDEFEDYEEGYNRKTGEYHWIELSYYTIPLKTNHFANWFPSEEEVDLYE